MTSFADWLRRGDMILDDYKKGTFSVRESPVQLLTQAKKSYERAKEKANQKQATTMATKYAFTNWKLAEEERKNPCEDAKKIVQYYKAALESYRVDQKNVDGNSDIKACLSTWFSYLDELHVDVQCEHLTSLHEMYPDDILPRLIKGYKLKAELSLEQNELKDSMSAVKDHGKYLEIAHQRAISLPWYALEVEAQQVLKARAKSLQSLHYGRSLYDYTAEKNDSDNAFEAMVYFREAIGHVTNHVGITVAEAYFCIGMIYDNFRGNWEKAIFNYKKALDLAKKDPKHKDIGWYVRCGERYKYCVEQREQRDKPVDAGAQGQETSAIQDLRTRAEAMRARGAIPELLYYISKKFVSRKQSTKKPQTLTALKAMDTKALMKYTQSLLLCYHPDRNRNEDDQWKTICREVAMVLNAIMDNEK